MQSIDIPADQNNAQSKEYGSITVDSSLDCCLINQKSAFNAGTDVIHVTQAQIDSLIKAMQKAKTDLTSIKVGSVWAKTVVQMYALLWLVLVLVRVSIFRMTITNTLWSYG